MNQPKIKVYLETTVFNWYFNPGVKDYFKVLDFFQEIVNGKFEPYTSNIVIKELEKTSGPKRDAMLDLIDEFNIRKLKNNISANKLAELYIKNNILTARHRLDALHIAIAAVNNLDMIVSLNFRDIARDKTRLQTDEINKMNGYKAINIGSPKDAIDYAETMRHS
jgi:rRNA-processing protein FCF1